MMNYVSYIIVALIPAVAVVVVVYFFLKKQSEQIVTDLTLRLKQERQRFFLEPRADAYQRIVLLMERINPHNLILRLKIAKKNAVFFQTELLDNIRNEFDHNMAQQIFVSNAVWDIVKKSKEETIKIINVAAQQLEKDATALDLCNKIFEIVATLEELPTDISIKAIKREFQTLF